jgi:S1-C subfamily serine protease
MLPNHSHSTRFDPIPKVATPEPTPAEVREPRRKPRLLLTIALIVSTFTGGAFGGVAATEVFGSRTAQVAATVDQPATALPVVAQVPPAASNIAGEVFSRVNPAVVQIVVAGQSAGGPMRAGSGSGFVVDATGLILTNNHVVENARAVNVRFNNGTSREAQVLGTDRGNDIALLKVDLPPGVPVATLGDSDQVAIGELAFAIGSPFGLDQTLTQGIISAIHRTWQPGNGRVRRNLIQTDASLNPGNSGGPLLNARGEVIGINSMIESPVRGSVGLGFAVPINLARQLIPQLQAGVRLEPVWLGISGQELDATIARGQGLAVQSGVLVVGVVPDGPAAQAGIRGGQGTNERIPLGGDVITAIDGVSIKNMTQLSESLTGRKPGDTIRLTIIRAGQQQHVQVTLQAWPTETTQ